MGGSSNSLRLPNVNKEDIIRKIRESDDQNAQNEYESAISELLERLLGQINNRDTEAIQQHIDTLVAALNDEIEGSISTKFGGSISKHTHLNGISDVDALIILNNSELAKLNPTDVLDRFAETLRNRLPNTKITKGDTAITVHYGDGDIQLIPAIRFKTGIKIPDDKTWSTVIKPELFSSRLTELNSKLNGRLVPAIKIIKGIISSFPEKNQLKGYHVESLALQVFESFNQPSPKLKGLVSEFFKKASEVVRKPIKDVTGQSAFVDEYLGKKESVSRLIIADNLERTYRQIEMADTGKIRTIWLDLTSNM